MSADAGNRQKLNAKRIVDTPSKDLAKKAKRMTLTDFHSGNRKRGTKSDDEQMLNYVSAKKMLDDSRINFEREKFQFEKEEASTIKKEKQHLDQERLEVSRGKLALDEKVAMGKLALQEAKAEREKAKCDQDLLFERHQFEQKLQHEHILFCNSLVKEGLYQNIGDALDAFPLPKVSKEK